MSVAQLDLHQPIQNSFLDVFAEPKTLQNVHTVSGSKGYEWTFGIWLKTINCVVIWSYFLEFFITVKAILNPRGACLILDIPEGWLIGEGGLYKKLDEKDLYDSFISLLPHILLIQYTILRVKYINSTESYPKLYQN